jgi:hypothetical protein
MDTKKDILAELDLADLFEKRAEAAKEQKEAAKRLEGARAGHLLRFWLGGCAMALAAIWLRQVFPGHDPIGMFLLSACVIFWIGMSISAFLPTESVRRRQDEEKAASKRVKDIDGKIAFCHQVLEEAKKVKVRRYAEAWVTKEMS